MNIEFYKHNLGVEEKQSVLECLDGVFLTTGQYVKDFESQFAQYLGIKHAVGVSSCTAALHLSLLGLGIGPGDEVITTPMTFMATANAILYAGAKPVFVDVEVHTGLINPINIARAITPRTKAVIPVHLYGQMCDMRAIRILADAHGVKIIEDCAHCVEGLRDGVRPGQLGDAACFSFYATKNMTCGEGGAIATNDPALAQRVMVLRNHGMNRNAADRHDGAYVHWDMPELGWKYNMSNIQAALLLPQVARIEQRWRSRDALYRAYVDALAGIPSVALSRLLPGVKSAYHLFTVRVDATRRDTLLRKLSESGIGCAVHYRAVHLLLFYRSRLGYNEGDFPFAERVGAETISLPFWIGLTVEEVNRVVDVLRAFDGDLIHRFCPPKIKIPVSLGGGKSQRQKIRRRRQ